MTPPAAAAAPSVHRGRTVAPGGRPVAPRGPRRVSGPARGPSRVAPPAPAERGLAVGLLALASGRSLHRLDRLIRGRAWIALVAFALIGIVALQLFVLKLNASIGRTLEREGLLQRENAALSIESSELAAGNLVESKAAALGMELVPVGSLRFLTVDPRLDAARAAAAVSAAAHSSPGSGEGATAAAAAEAPATGTPASPQTIATAPPSGEATSTAASGEAATTSAEPGAASAGAPAPSSSASPAVSPPAGGAVTAGGAGEAAPASPCPSGCAAGGTQTGGAG